MVVYATSIVVHCPPASGSCGVVGGRVRVGEQSGSARAACVVCSNSARGQPAQAYDTRCLPRTFPNLTPAEPVRRGFEGLPCACDVGRGRSQVLGAYQNKLIHLHARANRS